MHIKLAKDWNVYNIAAQHRERERRQGRFSSDTQELVQRERERGGGGGGGRRSRRARGMNQIIGQTLTVELRIR